MKKWLSLLLLSLVIVSKAEAQALLSPGVSANSFTASTGTSVAGTPYALGQGYAPVISWTTTFGSTPSAISVSLQGSQDNVSWFTLDTSTNTAGEIRYLNPIALKFVRAYITSRTGGSNVTVSLLVNRGFNNVTAGGTFTSPIYLPDGTLAAPSLSWASEHTLGFRRPSSNITSYVVGGVDYIYLGPAELRLRDSSILQWGSSGMSNPDTLLTRESAGALAQRNGTNAQAFRVYNTYTSSTNNERFSIDWQTVANTAIVGTRTAATGTGRIAQFVAQSTNAGSASAMRMQSTPNTSEPTFRFGIFTSPGGNTLATSNYGGSGTFMRVAEFTNNDASGSIVGLSVAPTYNQTGGSTAANTDLLINRTETAVGSGNQRLIDAQVGGSTKFYVDRFGTTSASGDLLTAGIAGITANTNTITYGNSSTAQKKVKTVTGIANAVATDIFTVTIPNAAHSAGITVTSMCYLGAGDAIGANQSVAQVSQSFVLTRTVGTTVLANNSSQFGNTSANGANTITVALAFGATSGAVGATQTKPIQVTVSRSAGSSTNHVCLSTAEIINANASGITIQ